MKKLNILPAFANILGSITILLVLLVATVSPMQGIAQSSAGKHTNVQPPPNLGSNLIRITMFLVKKADCNQVVLFWKNEDEESFEYYNVERSTNGRDFEAVAKVDMKGSFSTYTYADETPAKGTSYYRLKLVDKDNNYEYSDVLKVNLFCDRQMRMVSTVTSGTTKLVDLNGGEEIAVYNSAGILVLKALANWSTVELNLGRFSSGMYHVVVSFNGKLLFKSRVVKQ